MYWPLRAHHVILFQFQFLKRIRHADTASVFFMSTAIGSYDDDALTKKKYIVITQRSTRNRCGSEREGSKMATSEILTTVFKYQVAACKTFFQEELPLDVIKELSGQDIPPNLKKFKGRVFDITGFDGQQVVALLSYIVNEGDGFKPNQTFYLLIQGGDKNADFEDVFKLKARPTKQQPGNGIVFLRPKGKVRFKQSAKKYDELNGELKAFYEADTRSFAQNIKQVFNNNVLISAENFPRATIEVYMIWLFEIARRLVKSEKPSTQQMEYDILPIGSAIASLVRLLEIGSPQACRFEDVFLPKEKFHCFTGRPEDRKTAVHKINDALKEKSKKASKEHFLKELQEMFCSEERLSKEKLKKEQQLAKALLGLKLRLEDDSSSSEAEQYTAFDHCY